MNPENPAALPLDPTLQAIERAIDHASHLLPAQGPITVFIHHNTLHAFEAEPFDVAVQAGGARFNCQPYLSEQRFRVELSRGRIRFADVRAELRADLGSLGDESIASLAKRFDLRLAMLEHPLRMGPAHEIQWLIAEAGALRTALPAAPRTRLIGETRKWVMRELRAGAGLPSWVGRLLVEFGERDLEHWTEATWEAFAVRSLWAACRAGLAQIPMLEATNEPLIRHRDFLLPATGVDSDLPVHDVLIRYSAAFLDQGLGHWPLPDRAGGYFASFCRLYRLGGGPPDRRFRGLAAELARLDDRQVGPLESIRESFDALGVPESEWDAYLQATMLALRGWGGMIHHIEERADRVAIGVPSGCLADFVAIRLVLERFSIACVAQEALGYSGPLSGVREAARASVPDAKAPTVEERAYPVFQLAQVLGWTPDELARRSPDDWSKLLAEIESFDDVQRRRIFHRAYERRFRNHSLDALALYRPKKVESYRPRFQAITCIDEREESFRRHLEEAAPDGETFGAAGFFSIAMYYRGAAEAHFVPLCPVVVRPKHWVEERTDIGHADENQRKRRARRMFGSLAHRTHAATRTFAPGALLTAAFGVFAAIPLVARVLAPGRAARFRKRMAKLVQPAGKARLALERSAAEPGSTGESVGYSLAEMSDIAERLLRDIGLTNNFARLVLVIGHGSHSMNNPHESAHDCGACGGSVGGPNARAAAQMLNDPRVRTNLTGRGIAIPAETIFVGGLHNTCNENVKFFDVDRVPESHAAEFLRVQRDVEAALGGNAHERCRRFESAPLSLDYAGARRHMDNRAEDLAQVRPEWGHATNASCIVGRRSRTRGLYLDRRAFLVSYDPTKDDAGRATLTRILGAVFPVCSGISLEYYFSHVDPTGYGCGTKLPHNITSLLGVMDGAASDLRTGLPWQMVEIHEPMRLLFIIEVPPADLVAILERNPTLGQLVKLQWIQVATLDPDSEAVFLYEAGEFRPYQAEASELPIARTSTDWYRGRRDHLEFAEIR